MRPNRRQCGGAVPVCLALALAGCAKQVPVPNGAFEAQQRVVLSLKSDRQVRGRMEKGAKVDYWEQGKLFRARVNSLSDSVIVLQDLMLVRTEGSRQEVEARQSDGRVLLGTPEPERRLSRSDVQKVEQLRFDPARSARSVGFWSIAGTVVVLLLGERS